MSSISPLGHRPTLARPSVEPRSASWRRWELARRYLGHEGADGYIESTRDVTDRMCAVHIRPEHWLTRDYTKAGE